MYTVGAGAAGIAAGNVLYKHGIEFTILEAAPTIGGRIKHVEWEGLTVELGANWIHGYDSNFGINQNLFCVFCALLLFFSLLT